MLRRRAGGTRSLDGHVQLGEHQRVERDRRDSVGELRLLLAEIADGRCDRDLGTTRVACGLKRDERGEERREETGRARGGASCHGTSLCRPTAARDYMAKTSTGLPTDIDSYKKLPNVGDEPALTCSIATRSSARRC